MSAEFFLLYILILGKKKIFEVVNFVYMAAKQAASPGDVVGKLVEFGLSTSNETRAFAEEIYARVPRKNAGVNVSLALNWM